MGRIIALVVALGLCHVAWADFVYDGSDGSMIVGEDGSGYTLSYINKSTFFDTTADSEWTIGRGSEQDVGGKKYVFDSFGKVIFDDGDEAGGGNLNANAVVLDSTRHILSVLVYNNSTSAQTFNMWVEEINVTESFDDNTDRPLHYYSNTVDGVFGGVLVTKSTGELAAGESVTMSWDLFNSAEYTTLLAVQGTATSPLQAAESGDWLARLATRVQVGTSNTNLGLVTDVELTGDPVPEPGTWMLIGTGALLFFGIMRRRRMKT